MTSYNIASSTSFQTIVVVEPAEEGVQTPHVSVAIPKSNFEDMQNEIKTMKQKIQDLVELPETTGLIEALRTAEEDKSPLVDMFQILSLTKRLDGVELSLGKLASMMEDLARTTTGNNIIIILIFFNISSKPKKLKRRNLKSWILVVKNLRISKSVCRR